MTQAPGLGLLTTDRELTVRSWNAWIAAATGLDEARAMGQPLLALLPPDRRELYQELLAEVIERGTTRVLAPAFHQYIFPSTPVPPSPHFTHMQQRVTVAPLVGDAGVTGVIVTIEDMTAALDEQRTIAERLQSGSPNGGNDARAAIGAGNWRVRGAAVNALRQSASQEDIAYLLERLEREHQSLDVLSSALKVLTSANRDVVPPLIALLSDPHANLRMHAALALGQLGNPAAVPALIRLLDDEDANVRFHAIEALGRLGAPAAVEPLTRIAGSGDFFLSFPAVDALAKTDDPRVTPSLLTLLDHDLLRPAVVDTLAALGDEECVAPLAGLLSDGRGEAGPVTAALYQIRQRYESTFAAGDQIVELARSAITDGGIRHVIDAIERRETPLSSLVAVLSWMGTRGIDTLVSLAGEPSVQTEVVEGLVAIGRAAVPSLIENVQSGTRAGRLVVAALLGRLGDRRAVPALVTLLTEADAELVAAAAAALATLGDPRALDGLLALFAHEHAAVRQAAIAAVNAIGTAGIEASLRHKLSDPDPHVRECAVRVAGYFAFDSCVDSILSSLDDADEHVRCAAIEQLTNLEHPAAARRLEAALHEETPRNRAAAAHAARSAVDSELDTALLSALADPDPWVRYFAAGSLSERRYAPATAPLTHVATTDRAAQVRIAAMNALGALDPAAALPVAERMLLEADDDLSCTAIGAIAAVRDNRGDQLIEQAIRSASPTVRRCAIDALATRPTMAAVEALAWAARLTDSPSNAAAAVHALASIVGGHVAHASAAAVAALLDIGVNPNRRQDVADALSRVSGDDAIEAVAGSLDDAREPARLTAVEALARMRHPRASAALARALRDREPAVRAAAVAAFGRLGTPAVSAVICDIRDTDPDPAVRRKAAIITERYGWEL